MLQAVGFAAVDVVAVGLVVVAVVLEFVVNVLDFAVLEDSDGFSDLDVVVVVGLTVVVAA